MYSMGVGGSCSMHNPWPVGALDLAAGHRGTPIVLGSTRSTCGGWYRATFISSGMLVPIQVN